MVKEQLKNKTLVFEQDYIETDIKWGLKLGDKIFKKSAVKNAVEWLKEELIITNNLNDKEVLDIINLAFSDVIKIL